MRTETEYPFVAVHMKDKNPLFGFMYSDNSWSIILRAMTNNRSEDGTQLQINHDRIEFI